MNFFLINRNVRSFAVVAFLALLVPGSTATHAQISEPSREPILRLETGMHTAIIWRIGVDRAGKFLVTASGDKTARVWDLVTGTLLRVLRVPIGDGSEGRLNAAGRRHRGWERLKLVFRDIELMK